MKDRIIKFIEAEHISAAEFADKIGVQRSSVSHVLNGRNNPGFSFIQKILESFSNINSRWLLTGEGDIYINKKNGVEQVPKTLFTDVKKPQVSEKLNQTDIIEKESKPKEESEKGKSEIIELKHDHKRIVKVLIFYSDHTFEDFRPAE